MHAHRRSAHGDPETRASEVNAVLNSLMSEPLPSTSSIGAPPPSLPPLPSPAASKRSSLRFPDSESGKDWARRAWDISSEAYAYTPPPVRKGPSSAQPSDESRRKSEKATTYRTASSSTKHSSPPDAPSVRSRMKQRNDPWLEEPSVKFVSDGDLHRANLIATTIFVGVIGPHAISKRDFVQCGLVAAPKQDVKWTVVCHDAATRLRVETCTINLHDSGAYKRLCIIAVDQELAAFERAKDASSRDLCWINPVTGKRHEQHVDSLIFCFDPKRQGGESELRRALFYFKNHAYVVIVAYTPHSSSLLERIRDINFALTHGRVVLIGSPLREPVARATLWHVVAEAQHRRYELDNVSALQELMDARPHEQSWYMQVFRDNEVLSSGDEEDLRRRSSSSTSPGLYTQALRESVPQYQNPPAETKDAQVSSVHFPVSTQASQATYGASQESESDIEEGDSIRLVSSSAGDSTVVATNLSHILPEELRKPEALSTDPVSSKTTQGSRVSDGSRFMDALIMTPPRSSTPSMSDSDKETFVSTNDAADALPRPQSNLSGPGLKPQTADISPSLSNVQALPGGLPLAEEPSPAKGEPSSCDQPGPKIQAPPPSSGQQSSKRRSTVPQPPPTASESSEQGMTVSIVSRSPHKEGTAWSRLVRRPETPPSAPVPPAVPKDQDDSFTATLRMVSSFSDLQELQEAQKSVPAQQNVQPQDTRRGEAQGSAQKRPQVGSAIPSSSPSAYPATPKAQEAPGKTGRTSKWLSAERNATVSPSVRVNPDGTVHTRIVIGEEGLADYDISPSSNGTRSRYLVDSLVQRIRDAQANPSDESWHVISNIQQIFDDESIDLDLNTVDKDVLKGLGIHINGPRVSNKKDLENDHKETGKTAREAPSFLKGLMPKRSTDELEGPLCFPEPVESTADVFVDASDKTPLSMSPRSTAAEKSFRGDEPSDHSTPPPSPHLKIPVQGSVKSALQTPPVRNQATKKPRQVSHVPEPLIPGTSASGAVASLANVDTPNFSASAPQGVPQALTSTSAPLNDTLTQASFDALRPSVRHSLMTLAQHFVTSSIAGTDEDFVTYFLIVYRRFCLPSFILQAFVDSYYNIGAHAAAISKAGNDSSATSNAATERYHFEQLVLCRFLLVFFRTYKQDFLVEDAYALIVGFLRRESVSGPTLGICQVTQEFLSEVATEANRITHQSILNRAAANMRRSSVSVGGTGIPFNRESAFSGASSMFSPSSPLTSSSSFISTPFTTPARSPLSKRISTANLGEVAAPKRFRNPDPDAPWAISSWSELPNRGHIKKVEGKGDSNPVLQSPVVLSSETPSPRGVSASRHSRTRSLDTLVPGHVHIKLLESSNKLLSMDDADIASELTALTLSILAGVEPRQALCHALGKSKSTPGMKSRVADAIYFTNNLADLIVSLILVQSKIKMRVRLIEKLILVCEKLLNAGNYDSLVGIIAGLGKQPLYRLSDTWNHVVPHLSRQLEELQDTMSPTEHFTHYRRCVAAGPPSYIPYMGVILHDVSTISEALPDVTEAGINWEKFLRLAYATAPLLQVPPQLQVVHEDGIFRQKALDTDSQYILSYKLQPGKGKNPFKLLR